MNYTKQTLLNNDTVIVLLRTTKGTPLPVSAIRKFHDSKWKITATVKIPKYANAERDRFSYHTWQEDAPTVRDMMKALSQASESMQATFYDKWLDYNHKKLTKKLELVNKYKGE